MYKLNINIELSLYGFNKNKIIFFQVHKDFR